MKSRCGRLCASQHLGLLRARTRKLFRRRSSRGRSGPVHRSLIKKGWWNGQWRLRLRRCGRWTGNSARAFVSATSSAAPTALAAASVTVLTRLGSRCGGGLRLLEYGFLLPAVQFFCCLCYGFFCNFRNNGFHSCGCLFLEFGQDRLGGRGGLTRGDRCSQASERFFGLLFPLCAAKAFRGRRVPARGIGICAGLFIDLCEFERDHRVARAFV